MRILQMFNWPLEDIPKYLERIQAQGFDAIQLNPLQPSKESVRNAWWMSYQPIAFQIGNEFGSKNDLVYLCEEAKKRGIDIVVDVVCNHLANKSGEEWNVLHPSCDADIRKDKTCLKPPFMIDDYHDRFQVINYNIGLPGLNLNHPVVQKKILNYLLELKECGVKGFRFDAAKHIALPEEGCNFWNLVKAFLEKHNLFAYGEVLGPEQQIADLYAQYLDVHTNMSDYISPDICVSFYESHDNFFHGDPSSNLPSPIVAMNYRELCEKYDKTLFYMRPFDNTAFYDRDIKEGNLIRKEDIKKVRKVV